MFSELLENADATASYNADLESTSDENIKTFGTMCL